MYKVVIRPRARKQLKKLPPKQQIRIVKALEVLAEDPFVGKKLKGDHMGEYRWAVWPYRIIYMIEKKKVTVFVLAIGHRQGIY